ncbi:MAG: polysaccharide pyruvyl transferase family protein [Pseudomonadota bacterium]
MSAAFDISEPGMPAARGAPVPIDQQPGLSLFWWRSPAGNFGDDINLWLWDRLMPGWQDWRAEGVLVGVGSLLNTDLLPRADRYLVIGAGHGYGTPPRPADHAAHWDVRAVRGPITAELMGLDPSLGVIDPAAMTARLEDFASPLRTGGTLFVPHCHSDIDPDYDWPAATAEAGLRYQSPRATPHEVIRTIAGADLVVTESMHGAIIADAFRVPWVPVSLNDRFSTVKWRDWMASLEIEPPTIIPLPQPIRRARAALRTVRARLRGEGGRPPGTATPRVLAPGTTPDDLKSRAVVHLRGAQQRLVVNALRAAATARPTLSRPGVTEERLDRLFEIIDAVRRDYGCPR